MNIDTDSAQIRFPPPLILLSMIILGFAIDAFFPWPMHLNVWQRSLGGVVILVAIGLLLVCGQLFHRAGTNFKPWKTTTCVVMKGPYRYTRNPMYLSFLIFGIGLSIACDRVWVLLAMIPAALVLTRAVIQKEEAYLESKFGNDYRVYRSTVRRWL